MPPSLIYGTFKYCHAPLRHLINPSHWSIKRILVANASNWCPPNPQKMKLQSSKGCNTIHPAFLVFLNRTRTWVFPFKSAASFFLLKLLCSEFLGSHGSFRKELQRLKCHDALALVFPKFSDHIVLICLMPTNSRQLRFCSTCALCTKRLCSQLSAAASRHVQQRVSSQVSRYHKIQLCSSGHLRTPGLCRKSLRLSRLGHTKQLTSQIYTPH